MSEESKSAAKEGFEKCQRLATNPDFQWFIAQALTAPRVSAETKLKDLKTTKDDRENAAHVLDALSTAEQWLAKQSDIYERQSK